jgi:hypothetical protein
VPLDLVRGQDALINCAGHVADGETFVGLVDRLVTNVDTLPDAEQPVCWFLAGAALIPNGGCVTTIDKLHRFVESSGAAVSSTGHEPCRLQLDDAALQSGYHGVCAVRLCPISIRCC